MSIQISASDSIRAVLSGQQAAVKSNGISTDFQQVLKAKSVNQQESMDDIFEEASQMYGVPIALIKAVAKAESDFNPEVVSSAGAVGVMQLMPGTASSLGVTDPTDARQNIMGGTKYLKQNLDSFDGDVSLALAAYNAGPGAVRKYNGIPPYSETQNYVKKVLSYMNDSSLNANRTVSTSAAGSISAYGTSGYASLLGMGSSSYASLFGTGSSGYDSLLGLGSSSYGTSSLLGVSALAQNDTVTLDKETFVNLIQLMRIQMMMNTDSQVGSLLI